MPSRTPDERFVREDREEGLNININISKILKNLTAFAVIFPWYNLIEKQKS